MLSQVQASSFVFLASLLLPTTLAQNSGSFNVLTFNVAGLPSIINGNEVPGDKADNTKSIGTKFAQGKYDVIHVQEDFNYHRYLYETDNHPQRTSTSGGVPFGSGLNTLSNYPWSAYQRIKWDKCNLNSGDCLTPKGFTFMRAQIQGAEVDFYNLHADAGSDSGDANARRSGINQILSYVAATSAGRAVVIAGDTNDRWTNSARSIDLLTGAGFVDTYIERIRGGVTPNAGDAANACPNPAPNTACETVDKIFYRSGSSITLSPTSWEYMSSSFLQADGSILSDHNPILVNFSWSKK